MQATYRLCEQISLCRLTAGMPDEPTEVWLEPLWAMVRSHAGTEQEVPSLQENFVRDTRRLYRTDFFPGLGWMLRRQLWDEMRCVSRTGLSSICQRVGY